MTEVKEPDLMIPSFILKEAPKPPEEEKEPLVKSLSDDPFSENPFDSISPNFKKKVANLHYISQITGEYGTLCIRPGMSDEDILEQYSKKFPRECRVYLDEIRLMNQSLLNSNGMSKERQMMALTKIPELIYTAMKFIDEEYWFDKSRFYKFIRKFPKFMIGDHHRRRK